MKPVFVEFELRLKFIKFGHSTAQIYIDLLLPLILHHSSHTTKKYLKIYLVMVQKYFSLFLKKNVTLLSGFLTTTVGFPLQRIKLLFLYSGLSRYCQHIVIVNVNSITTKYYNNSNWIVNVWTKSVLMIGNIFSR